PDLRDAASRLNVDLDRSSVVHFIRHLLNINSSTLEWVAIGVTGYALLELVEGVGLWMLKRWAEYLTVVATAGFLPLEILELAKRVSYFKISILVLNLA